MGNSPPAVGQNPAETRIAAKGLIFVSPSGKLSHINLSKQVFAKNTFLSAITQLSEEITFVRLMFWP